MAPKAEENPSPTSKVDMRARPLMLGALSNYGRFAVMMLGMLFLTPFIIGHIGQNDFGLWMLIVSVVGYFELLDCGFATATVKFVGQYRGAGDTERRNQLASTLLVVYAVMATVIGILAVGLSLSFGAIFEIGESQRDKALLVLLALSLKVALNLPLNLFLGILFGQRRHVLINSIRIIAYACYVAAVWIALSNGYGLVQVAALNAAIFVLEHVAFFIICRLCTPDLALSLRKFDYAVFKKAAAFSAFALLTNVSALVLLRTDPIVISFFLPLTAVALYALSLKIAEQVLMLTKQFINVFTPLLAQLHGAGDRAGVRQSFLISSKYGLASLSIISLPLMYWSSEAMELWVGPDFAASGPILLVLVLTMHFRVLQEGASNVLGMTGRHKYVAFTSILSSLLNVTLSLILVWPMGLMGVAFATAISTFAVGVCVVVRETRRSYDVGLLEYCRVIAAPVVLPAAFQLVVCAYLRSWRLPTTLLELAAYCSASSLVFVTTYYLLSTTNAERRFMEERFGWLSRLSRRWQSSPARAASG
jgi:O-antigen/teichoic acid export membrane protein